MGNRMPLIPCGEPHRDGLIGIFPSWMVVDLVDMGYSRLYEADCFLKTGEVELSDKLSTYLVGITG